MWPGVGLPINRIGGDGKLQLERTVQLGEACAARKRPVQLGKASSGFMLTRGERWIIQGRKGAHFFIFLIACGISVEKGC